MPKDTLTFEIGGVVDIAALERGLIVFRRLVGALTPRNAAVSWIVEELEASSAVATLRGEAEDASVVEKVVEEFGYLGAILQEGSSLNGLRPLVSRAAEAVMAVADTAEYVRLATPDGEFIVSSGNNHVTGRSGSLVAVGTVTGRIQSMSNRGRLRFNIYDSIFDRAVVCFLDEGTEDRMREAWGKRARVLGYVHREPSSGRPIAVRRVLNIEILPEVEPGAYRQARGAVPWRPEYESGEEVIRRLRGA